MAKRKEKKLTPARPQLGDNVEILSAGEVLESAITDTLETNYMPYAMSVIVSRALPRCLTCCWAITCRAARSISPSTARSIWTIWM